MQNRPHILKAIFTALWITSFSFFFTSCNSPAATSLSFLTQPTDATPGGTTLGTLNAVQVQVLDQSGNLIKTNIPITLSIQNQPNSSFYVGLLGGTTTVSAVDGVATFSDLTISQIGMGYTLKGSAENLSPAVSNPFNINSSTEGFNSTNGAGFEIAYLGGVGSNFEGFVLVYVDQEPNPIDQTAFDTYSNPGYITNSPRYATFNYAHTIGSPNASPGPMTLYTDPSGYTWGYIAQVQNYNWPFDPADYPSITPPPTSGWQVGQASTEVPAGVVKYTNNNKNQQLLFTALDPDTHQAITRYFVTDEWGNLFILKSANNANNTPSLLAASFAAAILPEGWIKSSATLTQDLFVNPVYGATSNAQFLEFRDSADNAYSQIVWGATGDSIAQQIGAPIPLWSSSAGARVNGTPANDAMYGSAGDDQFYPSTGNDTIDGGGGTNTVFVAGFAAQYTLTNSSNTFTVTGPDGIKTLTHIQYLQCTDQLITLANVCGDCYGGAK